MAKLPSRQTSETDEATYPARYEIPHLAILEARIEAYRKRIDDTYNRTDKNGYSTREYPDMSSLAVACGLSSIEQLRELRKEGPDWARAVDRAVLWIESELVQGGMSHWRNPERFFRPLRAYHGWNDAPGGTGTGMGGDRTAIEIIINTSSQKSLVGSDKCSRSLPAGTEDYVDKKTGAVVHRLPAYDPENLNPALVEGRGAMPVVKRKRKPKEKDAT